MEKFDYMKYGKEYEEAMDYVVTIIAGWGEDKQNEKDYIACMINDYIRSSCEYKHLTEEEQVMLIEEVTKQYFME